MKYIKEYQKELKNTIVEIEKYICKSRKGKRYTNNPYKISVDIYNCLEKQDSEFNIPQKIRAFHNFYGWKAWGELINFGLCSGVIYRTKEYLNINPSKRTGKKIVKKGLKRIHVEHSVPISEIQKILLLNKDIITGPEDVFNKIIDFSVCTAFSEFEEKNGIKKGYSRKLYNSSKEQLIKRESIQPFKRYHQDVKVFDLLKGEEIGNDYSLDRLTQHYKSFKIYNWDFIEENYKSIYE